RAPPRSALGRGKGSPAQKRAWIVGWAAAAFVHRARARQPARGASAGRTRKIEQLLHELKSELTIVIVTHNLQQAARISTRTAFFFLGELVEADSTDRMFTRPREDRTEAYITGRFG